MARRAGLTLFAACAAAAAAAAAATPTPEDATITSGTIWTDDAGDPVHAHGGGLILPDAHPAGKGGKCVGCRHHG